MIIAGFAALLLFGCANARCVALRLSIERALAPLSRSAPCEQSIMYTIGTFDGRFGLSRQTFLSVIKEAETIWEKPVGKDLFAYADDGSLKINLIYDYRQQATSKLKSLGIRG